jgi:hypothetical protein
MAFRNPLRSLPASAITFVGSVLKTASTGNRVVVQESVRGGRSVGEVDFFTEVATDKPGSVTSLGPADGVMRTLALTAPAAAGVPVQTSLSLTYDPDTGATRAEVNAADTFATNIRANGVMSIKGDRVPGLGWASVKDFGAVADGDSPSPTDNSPAFQAAINAVGQGGVVYIPPGHYRLASTISLSLGVTLRGAGWSPHFVPRTNMTTSFLRPSVGGFTGTELIRVDPAPVNGAYLDSAFGGGPRIEGLALNGRNTNNAAAGPIAGIRITPGVKDVGVSDVSIWQFTGDGVKADQGAGMIFSRVVSTTNGGIGFNLMTSGANGGATDVDLVDCYSQGNAGDGFNLVNPNAVSLRGCRSEFNAGNGYTFTGINSSTVLVGCNTDRSGAHGFHFACLDGGKPFILTGCQAKRDGANGTTFAGFNIAGTDGTTQAPGVIFNGCSTYVGRNDDATGNRSPAYAIQANFTRRAQVNGGYMEGTLGAYNDLSVCLSRAGGITQSVIDPTTGVQTISNSDRQTINGAPGATRSLQFWTRGSGERWEARANGTAEAGANAGSDLEFARFSDAGAEIDIPFRITRSTGDVRFLGNMRINTAGRGLQIAEGTNAKMGTCVLNGATPVTVSTTAVTASSRVFLSTQSPGGTPGHFWVSAKTAGTSFAVTGTAGDTSTLAWLLIEP